MQFFKVTEKQVIVVAYLVEAENEDQAREMVTPLARPNTTSWSKRSKPPSSKWRRYDLRSP